MDATSIILSITGICLLVIATRLFRWALEPIFTAASSSVLPANSSFEFIDPKNGEKREFPSVFDDSSVSLSLIVPSYNESNPKRLPKMMKETMHYLEQRYAEDEDFTYEVIIVDDGSSDNTTEIGLEFSRKFSTEKVRVLTFPVNQGKGFAVQQGMLHARGASLLMVDADGASEITHLARLEGALGRAMTGATGSAAAVGSRAHLQEAAEVERAWYRNLLMHGFHLLTLMCVGGIRDTQCGFKLFSREAAQRIFPSQKIRRWCFDVELLFIASQLEIPVVEVPIGWHEVDGRWCFDVELLFIASQLEIPVVEVPIGWHEVDGSKLSLIRGLHYICNPLTHRFGTHHGPRSRPDSIVLPFANVENNVTRSKSTIREENCLNGERFCIKYEHNFIIKKKK
eukprot:174203_1